MCATYTHISTSQHRPPPARPAPHPRLPEDGIGTGGGGGVMPWAFKCLIHGTIDVLDGHRAGDQLAVHKDGRHPIYIECVTLGEGGFHRCVVLLLDALCQLRLVYFLLRLPSSRVALSIWERAAGRVFCGCLSAVGGADGSRPMPLTGCCAACLQGSSSPRGTLGGQAIGIDGGVRRPGMDLLQRVVLVRNADAIAIPLENGREHLGVHPGAERALQVVVDHDVHGCLLRIRREPGRPASLTSVRGSFDMSKVFICARVLLSFDSRKVIGCGGLAVFSDQDRHFVPSRFLGRLAVG